MEKLFFTFVSGIVLYAGWKTCEKYIFPKVEEFVAEAVQDIKEEVKKTN